MRGAVAAVDQLDGRLDHDLLHLVGVLPSRSRCARTANWSCGVRPLRAHGRHPISSGHRAARGAHGCAARGCYVNGSGRWGERLVVRPHRRRPGAAAARARRRRRRRQDGRRRRR